MPLLESAAYELLVVSPSGILFHLFRKVFLVVEAALKGTLQQNLKFLSSFTVFSPIIKISFHD